MLTGKEYVKIYATLIMLITNMPKEVDSKEIEQVAESLGKHIANCIDFSEKMNQ